MIETTSRYFLRIDQSIVCIKYVKIPTPTNEPTQIPDPQVFNFDGVSLTEKNFQSDTTFLKEIIHNYCGTADESNSPRKYDLITDYDGRMQINKEGKAVFNYSSRDFAMEAPWTFCQWDDSWMMETHEIVIVNGKILNHKTGLDEIFGWHLLKGKPVYFAKTGKKYSVSVDGKMLPVKYDEIEHYLCCAQDIWNPQTDGINTKFFAQRNGVWYSVLMSIN